MRPVLTAFVLGLAVIGALAGAAAVTAAVVADAEGWASYRVSLGPLLLTAFERSGDDTAAAFGPGLFVVALAGGALNALGAAWLLGRRG